MPHPQDAEFRIVSVRRLNRVGSLGAVRREILRHAMLLDVFDEVYDAALKYAARGVVPARQEFAGGAVVVLFGSSEAMGPVDYAALSGA